jgi:hypothetical protein
MTQRIKYFGICLLFRLAVAYPGIFSEGGGVQQIQLRIEGRENEDLGALAPLSEVPLNLQMNETVL